ncbi:MAG: outer membrane beta-barrel protein [Candidatus Cyclobacteriaceae bacterium M3_2C_046]
MKRFIFILITLIAFCNLISYAQNNWKSGIIVNHQSDSLAGYIRVPNNETKTAIFFSTDADGSNPKVLDTDTLHAFEQGNEHYLSVAVKGQPTQFLKAIVVGYASLFTKKSSQNENIYYFKKENQPAQQFDKVHPWNFLTAFFYDCEDFRINRNKSLYTRNDLIDLTLKYNQCTNPNQTISLKENQKILIIEKGIKVGYAVNYFFARTRAERVYTGRNDFIGGIYLNFDFGGPLSFQPELLWAPKYAEANRTVNLNRETTIYDLQLLQLPLLARYTVNREGTIRPYVYAGPYLYLPIKMEKTTIGYESLRDINPQYLAIIAGLGSTVKIKNHFSLDLELRYDNTFLSEGVDEIYLSFNSFQFLISIGL